MMKFYTKQWGDVTVNFEYNYPYTTVATMYKKVAEDVYEIIATEYVNRYVSDTWDKVKSRKLALTKLLKNSALDRDDRASAWTSYWSVCKK